MELLALLVLSQKIENTGFHPEVPRPLMGLLVPVWSLPTYKSFWKEDSLGENELFPWVQVTYPGSLPVWVSQHYLPKLL